MDHSDTIKKVTEDLLSRLQIVGTVSVDLDEVSAFRVHIDSVETGLLIGFHGRTLESFQLILNLLVAKVAGEPLKLYLNVGDYREKREEALMFMAQRAAERALTQNRPVELSRLSASERRIIHMTLSADERIETESVGEGRDRILLVKPKVTSTNSAIT